MYRRLVAVDMGHREEVQAIDRRGFWVGGTHMVRDGPSPAADVEDTLRIVERSVDDAVVHYGGQGDGLRFEAYVLGVLEQLVVS